MFAAVVILALVASAQAFPGSDSGALLLADVSEHFSLQSFNLFGNPATCTLEQGSEILELAAKVTPLVSTVIADLKKTKDDIKACSGSSDKLVCVSQAVRNNWEGAKEARKQIKELAADADKIIKKIKTCISQS